MADINVSQLKKRGGIYENLAAGTPADGVFVVSTVDGPVGRTKKGLVVCEEAGIFANGSDMTAAINAAYALAKVKAIEFHVDGGGEILITGTVTIPTGKVAKFRSGTMLKTTGSGVINGGTIEAGLTQQIISGTKNWKPIATTGPEFSVNWLGANNGVDENGDAITAAASMILQNPSLTRTLFFPDKNYTCTKSVRLANYNGGYQHVYIELKGNDNSNLSAIATTLSFTDGNAFGIGMQVGKGVVIRGLKIRGPFVRDWGTDMKAFVETKLADYSAGTGCRDTRYTPCTGIMIDFACGAPPPDGGWPASYLQAYYQGGITVEGSTGIMIEHCAITNWVLGVGVSINGTTLNADSVIIQHCSVEANKVNFAYGQDQTKRCLLSDIMVSDAIHTFVTTRMYGTGTGAPPDMKGYTIASKCNQIYDIDTAGRFGFSSDDGYAESTYRIGMIVGKPSIIKNLKFNASLAEYPGILGAPDLYGQFNNVTFEGGLIRNYDNLNNKRMHFFASDCSFKKVQFDRPPILQEGGNNKFEDCTCDDGSVITSGDFVVASDHAIANYLQHGRIRVEVQQNFTYCQSVTEYNFSRDYETRVLATNGAVLTVNATNRTATFPTGDEINYAKIGDYMIKQTPGNFFDYATPMPFEVVGRITSMSGGVTTLADVPVEVVSGTYNLYMTFFRTIGVPFVADSNSSAILTNVESSGYGLPPVGMRLSQFDFGISGNVYVKAVNAGLKQITLSAPAFVSFKNIEFNNYGERTIKGALQPTHPNYVNATAIIFTGNKFLGYKVDDDNVMFPQEFECIRPGFISSAAASVVGSSRLAVWRYQRTDIFSLSGNGTRNVDAGVSFQINMKAAADTTAVSIGTTPGGNDIADSIPLTAGITEVMTSPRASDAGLTLYFTGITSATEIRISKKSL